MKVLIFLAALLGACVASEKPASSKWDSLKVTWSINPFSSYAFATMPRDTRTDMMGFVKKDSFCNGNQPMGPYAGIRYWKGSDPAVMLIFDVNGIIAGIQTAVPKATWTPPPGPNVGHPLIDDGEFWTLTAYFIDPSRICNGRTSEDLRTEGTGTALYIQNGTDPLKSVIQILQDEKQLVPTTQWTKGHCFYTMGDHYWYNVRADMPCNQFFPSCLLYNKGQLNAFCWALNTQLTSPRYEHPTLSVLSQFIDPVPQCFATDPDYKALSTMHVYFSSEISDLC